MPQTFDVRSSRRATREEQSVFRQVKIAEIEYARKLRQLAKNIVALAREMMSGADAGGEEIFIELSRVINQYGDAITPWAKTVALKMVKDVSLRDLRLWRERSREISWGLQELVEQTPIGMLLQQRMADQVSLITSIPRDVAQYVHQLAIQTTYTGERFPAIARAILENTQTTVARANLIARTEVARTTTEITKARAEYVGSEGYVWRTAQDEDVRPSIFLPPRTFSRLNTPARGSHRLLEGKFIRWDSPPIAGPNGERAHAGCIYNCRCIPEVVIPGEKPSTESWRYVGGVPSSLL